MVIRGSGGGIYVQTATPRRRRPDWDNTVRDLKTLKLSAAELDARSRAFKSRDWSRPRKFSPVPSPELRNSEDGDIVSKLAMHRIKVRRDFLALKNSNVTSSCSTSSAGSDHENDGDDVDDENDFKEDIRRLESLQSHQLYPRRITTPPKPRSRPSPSCDPQIIRGSPNLLQYLETEIQKAWSDMQAEKEKPKPKRKKVKKKMKLQIKQKRKSDPGIDNGKLLDMVLATQKSAAVSTNQAFVQELQRHVQYQQNVIQELNQFRISATRELTNLVVLVQKLLTIQESKSPVVSLPASDDEGKKLVIEEKPPALPSKSEAEDTPTQQIEDGLSHHNAAAPKPREVPSFLMRRACTISKKVSSARPIQLQGHTHQALTLRDRSEIQKPAPDTKHLDTTQAARALSENKRRLYQRSAEEPAREAGGAADAADAAARDDEFDRRENPLFESDLPRKSPVAISRGPFKKSRLQEQSSSPTWKQPSSSGWKDRRQPADKPPPSSPPSRGRSHAHSNPSPAVEQPSLLPSARARNPQLDLVTLREQQGRGRHVHVQNLEQTSSPTWKIGRHAVDQQQQQQQQHQQQRFLSRRAETPTAVEESADEQRRRKKSTICIPARKPSPDEQHRVVIPVPRKKEEDHQNKKPPRYKLQRWSAALAQSGKENNVQS